MLITCLTQYWTLTKPRVVWLVIFCSIIGMCLATPDLPNSGLVICSSLGIWFLASSAFAINCLLERKIDARMIRTAHRPLIHGQITQIQTLTLATIFSSTGILILYFFVNSLTMWLTFLTFFGYTVVYTIILKPTTSQNIVLGGLFGAMPPALGWSAIANVVSMQAWILVLIIFVWTPPHFWTLALYQRTDYIKSGLPMLPITHGIKITQFYILVYSVVLSFVTMLPFLVHMSGLVYLVIAIGLNLIFLYYACQVYYFYTDAIARKMFVFSILYLTFLFTALLIDHYFN